MERNFDKQLEKLRTRIIKMCSLIDEQIELAFRAIDEENMELANLVIAREKKVDSYDLKIDRICQKIFALNQPVAMDLRLIMSALTINSHLERVGDIAKSIADTFLEHKKKPAFFEKIKFNEMTAIVKRMIRDAIDSFIEMDPELAKQVIETDRELDLVNRENQEILIELMKKNPDNIEPGVTFLVISRYMERLGDHATSIAEDVYFIVEAQMIKHNYEKFLFEDEDEDDDD